MLEKLPTGRIVEGVEGDKLTAVSSDDGAAICRICSVSGPRLNVCQRAATSPGCPKIGRGAVRRDPVDGPAVVDRRCIEVSVVVDGDLPETVDWGENLSSTSGVHRMADRGDRLKLIRGGETVEAIWGSYIKDSARADSD
jgi:hypothetical protein